MKAHLITADIFDVSEVRDVMIYRLYVDQDLITERSFIWDKTCQFIRENLILNLDEGLHTIRIEPVQSPAAKFQIKCVTVNNIVSELPKGQFIVQQ